MKILIYIALYQRYEIADTYYRNLRRLIDNAAIEIEPMFIYSLDKDKEVAAEYFPDATYVLAGNRPLGRKLNAGLMKAFDKQWDYLMGFGCDDILLDSYIDRVLPYLEAGKMCVGMRQLYYYDVPTGRVKLSHKTDMVFGAGRLLRRDIVEGGALRYEVECLTSNTAGDRRGKIRTIPKHHFNTKRYRMLGDKTELWANDKERALDASSMLRIIESITGMFTQTNIDEIYLLDLKTSENINLFDDLPGVEVTREHIKHFEI